MHHASEEIFIEKKSPICFQNPLLKKQAKLVANTLHQHNIFLWLFGGGIYKKKPSDLDFFIPDCPIEAIDALFRFLKYKKDPSSAIAPSSTDQAYQLVSAMIHLFDNDSIEFVDAYQKTPHQPEHANQENTTDIANKGDSQPVRADHTRVVSRNVIKIKVNGFCADIILSTGSLHDHANEVDLALSGAHYNIIEELLYFYNRQAYEDYKNGELNFLHPGKIKEDPSILLRTIRGLANSELPLSIQCKQLIDDHLNENPSVFANMRSGRLCHDLKLSFFSGHAVINLKNLKQFQLFDQLLGYKIPQNESDLKLQHYLIEKVAKIIDQNPSAYHLSLLYYAAYWASIKAFAYENPIFFEHMTSLSQPTILIPHEERVETSPAKPNDKVNPELVEMSRTESSYPIIPEIVKNSMTELSAQISHEHTKKLAPKKRQKKRTYAPNEILTAAIDESNRKILTELERKYHLTSKNNSGSHYLDALKKPKPIKINLVYKEPDKSPVSDNQKENCRHNRTSKHENRAKKKSIAPVTIPFIIEEKLSYDLLCERGNHFLISQDEKPLDATFYFQTAKEMHPDRPEAYVGLGKAAQIEAAQMENTVASFRTQYQKMSENSQNTPELKPQASDSQKRYKHQYNQMIGKYAQACHFYEQALTKKPVDKDVVSKQLEIILNLMEKHQDTHKKTDEPSHIKKKVKKDNRKKEKNGHQVATKPALVTQSSDALDYGSTSSITSPQEIVSKKAAYSGSEVNTHDIHLDSGLTAQKQGNFAAAKKHYQTYLDEQEKTIPSKGRYKFYYSLAEKIRSKIYQNNDHYRLLNEKKSDQTDLLDFLVQCYTKATDGLSSKIFHDAHIRIAEIKCDLNDHDGVINAIKPILDSSSENCRHHYTREELVTRLAKAYEEIKAYTQAKKYYQIALDEAEAGKKDVTELASIIKNIEKRQRIIAQLAKAKAEKIEKAAQAFDEANTYLNTKQYKEAIEEYQYVIKLDDKNLPAYQGLIKAYVAIDDYTPALNWCHFLLNIDEARYNKDFLPVQPESAPLMSYEYHRCLSLYQRGNIYIGRFNKTPSENVEEIDLGLKDFRAVTETYSRSQDPFFREDLREVMASSCLNLGKSNQMASSLNRESFKERVQDTGYQLDITKLLNTLIKDSIISAVSQKGRTEKAYEMMPAQMIRIIPKQGMPAFFATLPPSIIVELFQFINQIIIQEHNAFVWLNIAIDLTPDLHEAYGYLGSLEKSRGRTDIAKNYFLTALEKIETGCTTELKKFENSHNLVLWINDLACALKAARILSGITKSSVTSEMIDTDWIEFSKQFYQKAVEYSPTGTLTPNAYMLAIIRYTQQDYDDARIIFEAILCQKQFAETESVERELLFYCGKIYQHLKRYEKARDYYECVCKDASYDSDDPNLTHRLRILGERGLKEITALQQYTNILAQEATNGIDKAIKAISDLCSIRAMNQGGGTFKPAVETDNKQVSNTSFTTTHCHVVTA